MRLARLMTVIGACVVALPAVAADPAYITRVSDAPPPPPSRSWQEAGFRVELMAGYDRLDGFGSSPSGEGVVFGLQPGVQLTSLWSLDATMRYTLLTTDTMTGLRWAVTLGATLHPAEGLGVSLGLGYAATLSHFPLAAYPTVQSYCDGTGGALQARLSYLIPVLEGFATGPTLEAGFVGLQCGDNVIGVNDDGSPRSGHMPFWWQHTVSLVWAAAWR